MHSFSHVLSHWRSVFRCCLPLLIGLSTAAPAAARDMNISQFVFRDINRNGQYDRGEPPFAGVGVRLEQDGRTPILRRSNLAGFANFPMSDDDASQDITSAGPVTFAVELPEGMVLTTGNPAQSARILPLPVAPGGFVMEPVNPFMGIAPDLVIATHAEGVAAMTCTSGEARVTAEARGRELVCTVAPGAWTVTWDMADGSTVTRVAEVAEWPLHLPATPASGGNLPPLKLTFDDLITSQNIVELPSFDGFRFHNFVVAHHKFYNGWGYVNATVSGEFAAYNSSGHPARITSDRPFGLARVFLAAAWPDGAAYPVEITALRDGAVVATELVTISHLSPVLFEPRWADIDTLVIRHSAYWQVVMDDMELTR